MHGTWRHKLIRAIVLVLSFVANLVLADQIEMQNGDRYAGKVLSLDTNVLILQSDVLGKIQLPRERIALISLGQIMRTNVGRPLILTNSQSRARTRSVANATSVTSSESSAALHELALQTNLIQQVQAQFLAGAGPEANNKFNDLMKGLMTGRLTVNDIRVEARSAADQIRTLKRELGDDSGTLDTYLGILEHFLQETTSSAGSSTNAVAPSKE